MIYKLSDIFDLQMGKTPTRSDLSYWQNGSYDWISISDLNTDRKYISDTKERITTKAVRESGIKKIPANTVIMSFKLSIGKTAITSHDMFSNEAIMAFIDRKVIRINPDYIYYLLHALDWNKRANKAVKGRTVNKKIISQTQVNIPDYQTQLRIVKIMDSTRKRVKIQKDILSKLDTLIKARFVEMFGDPLRNDKTWPISKLKLLTTKVGSGATPKGGKQSYKKEGITLVRSMNVHDGEFVYKDLAYIDTAQAHDLDNVELQPKDVFINITGASVARSCVIPDNILPGRVNQHVAIIRCKENLLNYIFLNRLFLNSSFKQKLLAMGQAGGATRQALTQEQLKKLNLILPPIELQNEFASFVQQVDKSKVAIQKSLDEIQTLFDSLMQKYFS